MVCFIRLVEGIQRRDVLVGAIERIAVCNVETLKNPKINHYQDAQKKSQSNFQILSRIECDEQQLLGKVGSLLFTPHPPRPSGIFCCSLATWRLKSSMKFVPLAMACTVSADELFSGL